MKYEQSQNIRRRHSICFRSFFFCARAQPEKDNRTFRIWTYRSILIIFAEIVLNSFRLVVRSSEWKQKHTHTHETTHFTFHKYLFKWNMCAFTLFRIFFSSPRLLLLVSTRTFPITFCAFAQNEWMIRTTTTTDSILRSSARIKSNSIVLILYVWKNRVLDFEKHKHSQWGKKALNTSIRVVRRINSILHRCIGRVVQGEARQSKNA